MLRMNRHYLGHDYDTDVIAFKHEAVSGIDRAEAPIGDIFISSWMARRQARALGHCVAVEAATLAVHGSLHLLGHDDHRPAAKARMIKIQDRIVAELRKKTVPNDPSPSRRPVYSSPRTGPRDPAAGSGPLVEARAFQPGEIILVTVTGNDPKMPPAASLRERALDFFAGASTGTWLAFLGLDLEFPTGPATLDAVMRAPSGKPVRKSEFFNVVDAGFPIVGFKVERKFVTPDKNDSERAEAEAAKLHKLFAKTEVKRLFDYRFDSPIPGAATDRLGERRVFNGQPRAPHSGMDIKAKLGQPVRAPPPGRSCSPTPCSSRARPLSSTTAWA